jgi:hypothetical protein
MRREGLGPGMPHWLRRAAAAAIVSLTAIVLLSGATAEEPLTADLAARLTPEQRKTYLEWRKARDAHERQHKAYWRRVDTKREARKAKRMLDQAYDADDYVAEQPPKYAGPELPADIAKIVTEVKPSPPAVPLPTVQDFLHYAKAVYGFEPTPTTERDFKRNYAREALAVGLSKDQVVRIYALETGGQGTYDMQAGYNPISKQGRAISSALGYAQLLHANSVGELVKHGEPFARRLIAMATAPGTSAERAEALRAKAAILRRMLRSARTVPNEWGEHVKFAGTAPGLGIHALNLDADVGPWLQVLKLKALKDYAATDGRQSLSGSEIELMNLAGPRTGLEMMQDIGRTMPTSNFFSEQGYYRNTIVREKTAAELLAALNERMEVNMKKAGAVEFAEIFDEVARR